MSNHPDPLQALYDDPAVVNAMAVLKEHAITGEQYEQLIKPKKIQYIPAEPPTREELIALCLDGFVPQERWNDRDSAAAHRQLGQAMALLSAGCDFDVVPSGKVFRVFIEFRGFDWFEGGFDHEDRYLSDESFYVPTRARLDEVGGGDWYC